MSVRASLPPDAVLVSPNAFLPCRQESRSATLASVLRSFRLSPPFCLSPPLMPRSRCCCWPPAALLFAYGVAYDIDCQAHESSTCSIGCARSVQDAGSGRQGADGRLAQIPQVVCAPPPRIHAADPACGPRSLHTAPSNELKRPLQHTSNAVPKHKPAAAAQILRWRAAAAMPRCASSSACQPPCPGSAMLHPRPCCPRAERWTFLGQAAHCEITSVAKLHISCEGMRVPDERY